MVKPWSWEKSNGSADDWQMKAAVDVLNGNGATAGFFHQVWNDLVDKVNETAASLGRAWSDAPMKFDDMKISKSYQNLMAKMFNTLRYNTYYPWWSWKNDTECIGYVGRDDFHGVESYGVDGSDIVYGRYFFELTDRLNLVIGIVNGTADSIKLTQAVTILHEISAEMERIETLAFWSKQMISLAANGVLTQEKLDTYRLHYNIPTAEFTAIIQNGDFSECRTEITEYLNISRKAEVRPSVSFETKRNDSNILGSYADISGVEPLSFLSLEEEQLSHNSKLNRLHSVVFEGNGSAKLDMTANARRSLAAAMPWCPLGAMLTLGAKMSMDKLSFFGKGEFLSVQKGYSKADMLSAKAFRTYHTEQISSQAVLEQADLFIGLNADTESYVSTAADIAYNISCGAGAESNIGVSAKANAGVIRYAKANAETNIVLSDLANLETDGSWSYPVQNGSAIIVTQVYEIENNESHIFFDFGFFAGKTSFEITANANIDWQLKWEYPVQNGMVLFIPQSVRSRQYTSKLEVD